MLPLSMSNLPTSCDRNDLASSKLVQPILPDSSNTNTMSVGQDRGRAATATSFHMHYLEKQRQFFSLQSVTINPITNR